MKDEEYFSPEQASAHAKKWCAAHSGWQRICDIENSDALFKTWDELSKKVRKQWEKVYGHGAMNAWLEDGEKPCKVPYGFISGAGKFYRDSLKIPHGHNMMTIFKTGRG